MNTIRHWNKETWAVWGMGVSGVAAVELLSALGARVLAINKGAVSGWPNREKLQQLLAPDQLINQDDISIDQLPGPITGMILSPGIAREHPWIATAAAKGLVLWNEMELGYRVRPLPILALTGTNGKTTTTSLLGHILTSAGKKVFVGGNIGKAYCQAIMEERRGEATYELAVLEVSSFQLESLFCWQPMASAILNITPSHGERYARPEDYARAKANMLLLTAPEGKVFVPAHCPLLDDWLQKLPKHSGLMRLADDDQAVSAELKSILPLEKIALLGEHNRRNILFAVALARFYGLSDQDIANGIATFRSLPHRCEPVLQKRELLIVNDSKSTNWDSTLTALQALQENGDVTLMIGGKLRGRHDEPTPDVLREIASKAKHVLLFGEAAKVLAPFFPNAQRFDRLEDWQAQFLPNFKRGVLLFSPAYPSFDHYANYEARGEHFCKLIKEAYSSH